MGICLFCYERRPAAPHRLRENDINLHYKIFLCASPSLRAFSSTGCMWKYQICKYLLRKREEKSSEGKEIYLLLSPTFLLALWDPTRKRVCEKANKKKRGESPRALEKWQISLDSLARFRLHFKFNFNCTFSRIITNKNCFGKARKMFKANKLLSSAKAGGRVFSHFAVYCFNFSSWRNLCFLVF